MDHNAKLEFEKLLLDLLDLPKATRSFELRCAVGEIPTVRCVYEVWDRYDRPVVLNEAIQTLEKKYEIHLKEIEES